MHSLGGRVIRPLWGLLLLLLLGSSKAQSDDYSSSASSSSSSDYGFPGGLPCIDPSRNIHLHGQTSRLDDCTSCVCTNSTLFCTVDRCPLAPCKEPVYVQGECCGRCPNAPPKYLTCTEPRTFDRDPAIIEPRTYHHGEIVRWFTDCAHCTCDNGTVICEFRSCQPPTCREPVKIEGECCRRCPYNVTVNEVTPRLRADTTIREGTSDNEVYIDLDVLYVNTRETTSVRGQGLWQTRLWMSSQKDGSTELAGTVVEDALTVGQQSQDLEKDIALSRNFYINDIKYQVDMSGLTCREAKYVCAKFNRGPDPQVDFDFVFQARPSEAVLTGCSLVPHCKGGKRLNRKKLKQRADEAFR